jgi:hypothetical protein
MNPEKDGFADQPSLLTVTADEQREMAQRIEKLAASLMPRLRQTNEAGAVSTAVEIILHAERIAPELVRILKSKVPLKPDPDGCIFALARWILERQTDPDWTPILVGTCEKDSELLKIINREVINPRYGFKTFRRLQAAWNKKMDIPLRLGFAVPRMDVDEFLATRLRSRAIQEGTRRAENKRKGKVGPAKVDLEATKALSERTSKKLRPLSRSQKP